MMPQTVPNNPTKGVTAPVVASHTSHCSSRPSSVEAPICRARRTASRLRIRGLPGSLGHGGLALNFAIAGLENLRQRALLQGAAESANLRQLLALPENLEEFQRFALRGPEDAKFAEDNRPGENGKSQKHQQDKPGHRTRVRQELPNFALVEILRKTLVENQKCSSQLTSLSRPGD